jgi:crotonobetainyl-CoA:carnitine CoA-transferase CaiB-like acyl-CoA transferase
MTAQWNHPGQAEPVGSQSSYPDFLAGAYAAYAILVALHRREHTGRGMLLDLSQAQVTASAIGPSYVVALNNAEGPGPVGNTTPTGAPYGCYPCQGGDDAWCVIAVESDAHWAAFKRALGDPEWAGANGLATVAGRIAQRDELDEHVACWTRQRTPREVMDVCQRHSVPAGMVATGEDLIHDRHLLARGFLVEREHPRLGTLRLPGCPVRFHNTPLEVWRFGPLLGEDTDYVMRQVLRVSAEDAGQYAARGALT